MPATKRPPIPIPLQVQVHFRDAWLCHVCRKPVIFHLALKHLGFIKMIIMTTDVVRHPRFGQDTQYNFSWISADSFKIDGPERDKWEFKRAPENVRFDFDASKPAAERTGSS